MRLLNKQKQLLEVELQERINNNKAKKASIHSDMYYVKIAHAYKAIAKSIKLLASAEKDVYNNHESTKH